MDVKQKIAIIHNLLSVKKFTQAIINCHKLIKQYPNVSYLYNLCGMAYQGNKQIKKSVESFNLALNYDSENSAAMNNLANSYKFLNQNEKADELFKKILKKDPDNILFLNNYANLKQKLRDYESAKKLLLKALETDSKNKDILINLVECYQSLGQFDRAKEYAYKILDLYPNSGAAHRLISGMTNYNFDKSHLLKIEEIENSEGFKNFLNNEKKDIYFSLGKAYEDIKDYEKSFNCLKKGNLIVNKETNYNIFNDEKLFKNIVKTFKDFDFENFKKKSFKKELIFICGMPRSGTTLVEQMIAAHEEVSGAGELSYLTNVVTNIFWMR